MVDESIWGKRFKSFEEMGWVVPCQVLNPVRILDRAQPGLSPLDCVQQFEVPKSTTVGAVVETVNPPICLLWASSTILVSSRHEGKRHSTAQTVYEERPRMTNMHARGVELVTACPFAFCVGLLRINQADEAMATGRRTTHSSFPDLLEGPF